MSVETFPVNWRITFVVSSSRHHRLIKNRFEFSAPKYYDFISHRQRGEKRRKEKETETAEMYFETSEKLNGTFPFPHLKGRVFEIPWGGAHIIVVSSYATTFFTRIYHHTTVTLTFVLSLHALFRAFWSLFKNNRIRCLARPCHQENIVSVLAFFMSWPALLRLASRFRLVRNSSWRVTWKSLA